MHHNVKNNQISGGLSLLWALEEAGLWLFHGSSREIAVFEPKQAFNVDSASGKQVLDGAPAICAAATAAPAIFRAMINRDFDTAEHHVSGWTFDNQGQYVYYTTHTAALAALKPTQPVGYVHVLKREAFEHWGGDEWRRYAPIAPDLVIEVTQKDLPSKITIVEPVSLSDTSRRQAA